MNASPRRKCGPSKPLSSDIFPFQGPDVLRLVKKGKGMENELKENEQIEESDEEERLLNQAKEWIGKSSNIIVLTGAGISTGCGIPG